VLGTLVWSIISDRRHAAPGVDVGVAVGVGVGGGGVGVGVGVDVGIGVGVGVGVGVGEGVAVAQLSLPMVINVPGELWLLYSVVIQVALRVDELNLTSSRYVAGQNTVSSDCAIK